MAKLVLEMENGLILRATSDSSIDILVLDEDHDDYLEEAEVDIEVTMALFNDYVEKKVNHIKSKMHCMNSYDYVCAVKKGSA